MTDENMNEKTQLWVRIVRSLICFAIAGGLVWRGYTYQGGMDVIPVMMCAVTAFFVALIGLVTLSPSASTRSADYGPA